MNTIQPTAGIDVNSLAFGIPPLEDQEETVTEQFSTERTEESSSDLNPLLLPGLEDKVKSFLFFLP